MTNFLSPASEALDDASLHSGVVVGLKVEIVVGMCLLSEHRSEDGGALSFHHNIQEGKLAVGLFFHSKLDGRMLAVEVVMEFTEVVVRVGPDCKHVVNVPHP